MRRQWGQAMAEYLVVLGVSGSLIAALTLLPCDEAQSSKGCIPTILDALHNNYQSYSASLSGVQDYGQLAVAAPPSSTPPASDDDSDDADQGEQTGETPDTATETLQVLEVADSTGKVIGTVQNGRVIDANGNDIGAYLYDVTNSTSTVVIDGQTVVVSLNTPVIGSDGKAAVLKAFVNAQGQVVGFGYFEADRFYDAFRANKVGVPSGTQAVAIRPVKTRDDKGNDQPYGYEAGGYIYSQLTVLTPQSTYATSLVADGELLEMRFSEADTAGVWSDYSSCVVREPGWTRRELSGYAGSGNFTFNKFDAINMSTSNHTAVATPEKISGFIEAGEVGAGGCAGRWVLQEGAADWTLSGPFARVQ
ncbi:hypothetical protein SAMN05216600_104208 [Pseudomonas cuatrocienegasensis]|uniref:Uncharacterized protein n=1 Tax=Pseudomonas cuatrocienegasensis TaxID=543360 RepID=A0ABY1B8Y7_9PSED|nr:MULTISPECIES: hypothetical protein [Pseudomonas]OEC35698.1 hypothetical protein A7D25_07705 [Pseudomonas sp. 21C1]SEQ24352.1 hypothetical protein SAMN05216600_104208 [Pseudomonas cuatrocienegasensis]